MPTVGAQEKAAGSARSTDRRGAARYECRLETFSGPIAKDRGLSWLGKIVNISLTGLCLECTRRFQSGTFILVELEAKKQHAPVRLPACVIHSRQLPSGGGWAIGCEFMQKLSDQDLKALLS
jgi:PilZ domain